MIHGLELKLLEQLQRTPAASARRAMYEIGFGAIQFAQLLGKIVRVEIHIPRPGQMTAGEFAGRAHIQHDHVFVRGQQLFAGCGIDVFDGVGGRGFVRGSGGKEVHVSEREQTRGEHNPAKRFHHARVGNARARPRPAPRGFDHFAFSPRPKRRKLPA